MCLGYPAQDPDLKPRLPTELFCYENSYQALDKQALENYNAELSSYYQARTGETRIWQDAITGTPTDFAFFQQARFAKTLIFFTALI